MKRFSAAVFVIMLAVCVIAAAIELDEAPAVAGEWGYRPDDGAKPDQNPPGFTWRACDDAASYTLQVARDTDFKDVVYNNESIRWNAHCPPTTLPEGRLYWRYSAQDAEGHRTAWSRTRAFDVTSEAVAFPCPTTDDLLARMPAEHPRLFFRPEDVARFRELAGGALAERWNGLRAQADALLEKAPDVSEPPLYPEGVQRLSKEWKSIWWGNRERVVAVADGAALLAFVYRVSGEDKYAQAARDLVMAMTKWDPEGSTKYDYNDEAAMPALYMTSRAYTWAYPAFSEADRAAVAEMMRARGAQAFHCLRRSHHLWRPFGSHNNRCWHYLGELAITFYGEIPEAREWLDYAMTVFFTCYPAWGDADGGWHEGVSYWSSYTSRVMWWGQVIHAAFGIDMFVRPFYHHVGDYPMYAMPPGSETGGFGDLASHMTAKRAAPLVAQLAVGAKNPYWQWYVDENGGGLPGGYFGFICAAHAAGLDAASPEALPTSKAFYGTGLAFLNSNLLNGKENVQIHFKSSPFGRQSHGYNANNAFLLNIGGREALVRSGERDVHGSPHHVKWMWDSRSDNAILVNGEGQTKHSPASTGRITAFETSAQVDLVVGEAGGSYDTLERWTRRIVFLKPHAVVIHDVLEANDPSSYTWCLHARAPFTINEDFVTLETNDRAISVRFLEPRGLSMTQTDVTEPPPAEWYTAKRDEWHLWAETREKSATMQFVTLIEIGEGVSARFDAETRQAVVTTPAGEATITCAPEALRVEGCGVTWEAR